MNNTIDTGDGAPYEPANKSAGGFTYGLGFSLGILFLLLAFSYISTVCKRRRQSSAVAPPRSYAISNHHHLISVPEIIGLDEAFLVSFPKFLFSELKIYKGESTAAATGCSICLTEYNSDDLIRLLPECGHMYHVNCVDPWLRIHPTCPICRNSPVPTPFATPLAAGGVPNSIPATS